jgi:two-component system response regulator HydG
MPCIRIIAGFGAGQAFALADERVTIGRDAANAIQIGDPKSSRMHAEVVLADGVRWLRDLASSNGTWNAAGRLLEHRLRDGDVFRIGLTSFRYEAQAAGTDLGQHPIGPADQTHWSDPALVVALDRDQPALLAAPAPPAAQPGDQAEMLRANAYLVLLHQLVLRANRAASREQLFELLDDAAADVLDGDRCAVFLPAPEGWSLWPAHERRLRARFGAVPFARTLLAAVRVRAEPLLCTSDGDLDPTVSMAQAGVTSAMAAPLRVGDEVHALLYVDRIGGSRPFTRVELEFLAAVANQLAVQVHNQAHVAALTAEVERLAARPAQAPIALVGRDETMAPVRAFIEQAAASSLPVLIEGESGTGKELVARAIHAASARREKPFHVVHTTSKEPGALEGALFGAVVGEGASEHRPGLFELADGASVFVDDLDECPAALLPRLQRLISAGEVQRQGDVHWRRVDVRLIIAMGRQPGDEPPRQRGDLLPGLEALRLLLPPLRQRGLDIDVLLDHFLAVHAQRFGHPLKHVSAEARAVLLRYAWPGNVRQLRDLVERCCVLTADRSIGVADLPEYLRAPPPAGTAAGQGTSVVCASPLASLASVERAHILAVLQRCGGNKKATAEVLGIDRSTLYAKLRGYGVA